MRSGLVEFRLLQLVCNPIGDERVTVALIHWDGQALRFAWSRTKVPSALAHVRGDILAVLGSIRRSVSSCVAELRPSLGLDHVYPVPEGYGSLLVWGPLRVGATGDAQAHFEELVRILDLHLPGAHREATEGRAPRASRLSSQLAMFGEQLLHRMSSNARGNVRVRHPVSGLREYESPLSWMNGRWHHSFPLDLAHVSAGAIVEKYEKALGRIDVSIPQDDIGFIVAVHERDSDLERRVSDVEAFIKNRFATRVDCMSVVFARDGTPDLGALAARVEHDVTTAISGRTAVPELVSPASQTPDGLGASTVPIKLGS